MENERLFEFMEKMYSEMQTGFKSVNEKFDTVNHRLSTLEAGQITLENKLDDTRKTLFDGYMQTTEKLATVEDKLDNLKIEVNSISMKTTYNDSRIIEISKDLKKAK